ncbi:hypothetical protein OFN60_36250, partial [Escherichia coli]|nr:hypothetical protein [Escherichia coli]
MRNRTVRFRLKASVQLVRAKGAAALIGQGQDMIGRVAFLAALLSGAAFPGLAQITPAPASQQVQAAPAAPVPD